MVVDLSDRIATSAKSGALQTPRLRGRMGPVFAGNVAFDNVTFATARQNIIQPTSFRVEAGTIACILGPSGCGKTTLLRLAAGVTKPRSGRIVIDDKQVAGGNVFVPPEERKVGLMFQDFALFPHMTAVENVAYGLYALPRSEALKVAAAALETVGLPQKATRYPGQLSGGEQQRVALARAIVPRPRVLLMDEPFSNLDQRLRETMRAETLSLLRQSQATVLLVTHDPLEALAVADHLIVMREGRIVQQGAPAEVLSSPHDIEVARFLGTYNEFTSVVRNGQIATPLGHFSGRGMAEGTKMIILMPASGILIAEDRKSPNARVLQNLLMPDFRHYRLVLSNSEQVVEVKTGREFDLPAGALCRLAMGQEHPQMFKAD